MRMNVPSSPACRDEPLDVAVRELFVEREPEMGELQRDVRAQAVLDERGEHALVGGDDLCGAGLVLDRLAQQRRVRVQPVRVEAGEDDEAFLERLAGDEPRRARAHAVPADEAPQARALRGAEDRGAGDGGEREVLHTPILNQRLHC